MMRGNEPKHTQAGSPREHLLVAARRARRADDSLRWRDFDLAPSLHPRAHSPSPAPKAEHEGLGRVSGRAPAVVGVGMKLARFLELAQLHSDGHRQIMRCDHASAASTIPASSRW